MSNLFISHSSHDNAAARALQARLAEQGHHSVFLDLDPATGIQAGVSWERTLYTKLRACRAVVALCSDSYLASQWCFAEIALARMEGKQLFVLQIDPWSEQTKMPSILTEEQFIDLRTNLDDGYQRLWNGFKVKGIVAAQAREWKPEAPPYPGLRAFREEDAPIFFGRDDEIREGAELLNRVRRQGHPRLVMVLGSSGSGKSSLVRAGIVPQLRRDRAQWLVVKPLRPGPQPARELAASLSHAFAEAGQTIGWETIHRWLDPNDAAEPAAPAPAFPASADAEPSPAAARQRLLQALRAMEGELTAADDQVASSVRRLKDYLGQQQPATPAALAEGAPASLASPLAELATRLRLQSGFAEATVVLVIDQFEELLGHDAAHPASRFLTMLRTALEAEDSPLLALGTVRSDYLDMLQRSAPLQGLGFKSLSVGPMSKDGMREVIEEPAKLGQIELERGLSDILLEDTGTSDALPLLAFTLRMMWDRYRDDRLLSVREYIGLGRLQGAIAQVADETFEDALQRVADKGERAALARALRDAFLGMARPAAEGSGWSRRPLRWDTLSETVGAALEAFIEPQRLLVKRQDGTVEVAHEALFRSWARLKGWLDENAEGLHLLREIQAEAAKWADAPSEGEKEPYLWRGGRLARARELQAAGVLALQDLDRGFVDASMRAETAQAQAEATRQRRELRRTRVFASVVGAAFLVAVGLAFYANRAKQRAEDQTLVAVASDWLQRDPTQAALVLTELRKPDQSAQALALMGQVLMQPLALHELAGHQASVTGVALSPRGDLIATASGDRTGRLWTMQGTPLLKADSSGAPVLLRGHDDALLGIAFSANGDLLVTASQDKTARLWHANGEPLRKADGRSAVVLQGHAKAVNSAAFNPAGDRIVTASDDGKARVWNVDGTPVLGTDGRAIVLDHGEREVNGAAFNPRGDRIVTAGDDGTVRLWNADGSGQPVMLNGHSAAVMSAAFSADGLRIVTASLDTTARLWNADGSAVQGTDGRPVVLAHSQHVFSAGFSQRGDRIVTASKDGAARVWLADGTPVKTAGSQRPIALRHAAEVNRAVFTPSGEFVITGSKDGTARIWATPGGDPEPRIAAALPFVIGAVFGPEQNGQADVIAVVDASREGTLTLVHSAGGGRQVVLQGHRDTVNHVAFSAGGDRIVTASNDGTARVWRVDGTPALRADGSALVLDHGKRAVNSAAFNARGDRIVSAADDGTLWLWTADGSGQPVVVKAHTAAALGAEFSADGARIVTVSQDRTARVWHADGSATGVVLTHNAAVNSAAFDPTGDRIVTAADDKIVRVWRADGGGEPIHLRGHQFEVLAAAFSPSGQQIVSASQDNTARVWRADGTGEPLVLAHETWVLSAAFDRSGKHVVSTSRYADARVWRVTQGLLGAKIRTTTEICLDPEFRQRALGENAATATRAHRRCNECTEQFRRQPRETGAEPAYAAYRACMG